MLKTGIKYLLDTFNKKLHKSEAILHSTFSLVAV